MGSPRGKSNREKYDDTRELLQKVEEELSQIKRSGTKKEDQLRERRNRYLGDLEAMEEMKDLPHLTETAKKVMRSMMIRIKYKRYQDIDSKHMKKGRECEEAGITLYSLVMGKVFENNKERRQSDYFDGEIDLPWKDDLGRVYRISDIKNSWSVHSFYENEDKIKAANKYQGIGYFDLYPDAQEYSIANVLVDNTDDAILLELQRESYKWHEGDTPNWRELQIVKEHIFTQERFDQFIQLRGCTPIDDESKKVYESFVEIPM